MEHTYEYAYGRVVLKPLERKDIEELRVLRNRERQYFLSQGIIMPEGQITWYDSYLKKENDIMFKVARADRLEKFIGAIAVYDIDKSAGCAEFGRLVIDKEKAPEKGIGLEATVAACNFAFEKLGVSRITAVAVKDNERALKVYAKAGFRVCDDSDEEVYVLEVTRELLRNA